jgi:G3E family GTPase
MIDFIALSGFLGAGKTTTMTTAAQRLREAGKRVVVITNDQGTDLVDTMLARRQGERVGEVTGGCFCCRFEDLFDVTTRLVQQENADVVIAESVGSCTDLTATVIRPMRRLHGDAFRVAPLTTVVDPVRYLRLLPELDRGDDGGDLAYLFGKQLQEAAIIGVNKADLLDDEGLAEVLASLAARCPQAEVLSYSAARGDLAPLLEAWTRVHGADQSDLPLDYDRYAKAEAQLAWLNQAFDLHADDDFSPASWARTAMEALARRCRAATVMIGHIKIMVGDGEEVTKASLIDADTPPCLDLRGATACTDGRAVVNARVGCEPEQLDQFVTTAVKEASEQLGVTASPADAQHSFKPGRPNPTHRILVGVA